jgi:O-antigen/teichoic acid export membrane protein
MPVEVVPQAVAELPANRDGATQKFIRDIFFSNLPVPFQKFCSYLLLVVFARKLGPRDYGAWSLFNVSLTIAVATATLNAGSSMMRFLNGDRTSQDVDRSISTVFTMVGVTTLVIGTVIAGLSNWGAATIFHDRRDRVLLLLLAAALPFSCLFEEVRGFLRARRLNRNWALLTLSRLIPETLALVLIARSLLSVTAVAWTYLVCEVLAAVWAMFYLSRYRRIRFVRPSRAVMTRYLSFGVPLLPGALAYFLQVSADRYLVGYYLDLKQVGIYSVCFSISALAFFLLGPINDVLFPELSALYDSGDAQAFLYRFSGIQKFVFGSSLGAAALLTAFPADVLMIFSSRDFTPGSTTLVILGIQGIFMALVLLYAVLLNVRLKVWSYSWFWVGSGAVIVVLDVLLVPRIGIAGAAVSQLVATAGGAIVLVGLNWQLFRQSFPLAWLLQNGVAFGATFAVAAFWPHSSSSGGLQSYVHLVAGSAAFVAGLAVTGYLRSGDFELFRTALLSRAA